MGHILSTEGIYTGAAPPDKGDAENLSVVPKATRHKQPTSVESHITCRTPSLRSRVSHSIMNAEGRMHYLDSPLTKGKENDSAAGPVPSSADVQGPKSRKLSFVPPKDNQCVDYTHGKQISWKRGQLLASGAFGDVYLGIDTKTGGLMAVKQVSLPAATSEKAASELERTPYSDKYSKALRDIENELTLLRSMKHSNIVNYLGSSVEKGSADGDRRVLNIFLEYVPGGSIASLLRNFGAFDETVARAYTRQILVGLEFLHRHGIVHRDIKGGNVLVHPSGACKLADFGASTKIKDLLQQEEHQDGDSDAHLRGTIRWMAPEILKQEPQDSKIDIWSVGCTVLEMISGQPPWSEFTDNTLGLIYHLARTDKPPSIPPELSVEGKDFVLACLNRDPTKRPTAKELLAHPFVAQAGVLAPSVNSAVQSMLDTGSPYHQSPQKSSHPHMSVSPFHTPVKNNHSPFMSPFTSPLKSPFKPLSGSNVITPVSSNPLGTRTIRVTDVPRHNSAARDSSSDLDSVDGSEPESPGSFADHIGDIEEAEYKIRTSDSNKSDLSSSSSHGPAPSDLSAFHGGQLSLSCAAFLHLSTYLVFVVSFLSRSQMPGIGAKLMCLY